MFLSISNFIFKFAPILFIGRLYELAFFYFIIFISFSLITYDSFQEKYFPVDWDVVSLVLFFFTKVLKLILLLVFLISIIVTIGNNYPTLQSIGIGYVLKRFKGTTIFISLLISSLWLLISYLPQIVNNSHKEDAAYTSIILIRLLINTSINVFIYYLIHTIYYESFVNIDPDTFSRIIGLLLFFNIVPFFLFIFLGIQIVEFFLSIFSFILIPLGIYYLVEILVDIIRNERKHKKEIQKYSPENGDYDNIDEYLKPNSEEIVIERVEEDYELHNSLFPSNIISYFIFIVVVLSPFIE